MTSKRTEDNTVDSFNINSSTDGHQDFCGHFSQLQADAHE